MRRLIQSVLLITIIGLTGSCSNVGFRSPSPEDGSKTCTGAVCPNGLGYAWSEGGFNMCTLPCGGGDQTQTVECRRTSDDVVVPDGNCIGTKPVTSRTCNTNACTTSYAWNWSDFGTCSKTCGGGTKTRTVLCQDVSGNTVSDETRCPVPKPDVSLTCNGDPCTDPPAFDWAVTPGACSVQCGGGTATDVVVCKKSDGSTVPDSNCSAKPKPSTTRTCNTQTCPQVYTYTWVPEAYGACSKTCGDGTKSRSIACQRNDGVFVAETYCNTAKPPTTATCHEKDCPVGTPVTQTATVTPASNSVDVVLVIDDSNSMKNDQTKLAARLIQLVTDLDALNIDYQMCLTTTDISYYRGSPIKWQGTNSVILNKATPNKNSVFINTVNSLGAEWSSDEQGIKATWEMLHDFGPNSGASNAGCFRSKATLTVIAISDEDERSVGGNQALSTAQYQPLTTQNMPDTLISLVHSTFDATNFVKPFIWNSIIVKPGDQACENQEDAEGSPSFPGVLLSQLSNKTGGQIASICDADYAHNMTLIKNKIVNSMPGLTMQCTPIGNAVVTFSPAFSTTVTQSGNQLKFTPALPENTQVTAKYTCP